MDEPPFTIQYQINRADELVHVNDAWRSFAIGNATPALSTGCLGTSLWRHIQGADVRQIYRELLHRVRATGNAVRFPFRCDSPLMRREMSMEIAPTSDGGVDFRVALLDEKQHQERLRLLECPASAESDELLRICSWCKSVWVAGGWLPLEQAIKQLGLLSRSKTPGLTHGICQQCMALVAANHS